MTDFIERGLKAFAVYWGGIHLIGFMMFANGQTERDYWLWGLISPIFILEAWLLGLVVAAVIIYLVYDFCTFDDEECEERAKQTQLKTISTVEHYPKRINQPTALQEMPVPPPNAEPPKPPPPPLTPEELKRKALRQITGKEF